MSREGGLFLRQIAVIAGYALSYALLRSISFSYWIPLAGFRLCWLLLLPPRYWPSLLLGELGPLIYTSYTCASSLGLPWAFFNAIPPIMFGMPLVRWCQQRWSLFGARRSVNTGPLLFCTLLVSLLWAAVYLAAVALMHVPDGKPPAWGEWAGGYVLGNYLGILTVTPLVLVIREAIGAPAPRLAFTKLMFDGLGLVLPSVALLVWISISWSKEAHQVARIAMFLPVAWIALRHGWRGAALGGAIASVGIVLTMPALYDPSTIQAQVFMAFAMTTLLMLGARIGLLHAQEEKERAYSRQALHLAQQGLYMGEVRMRHTALALEHIAASIHETHARVFEQFLGMLPASERVRHNRQAAVIQQQVHRLADNLYPRQWENRGLPSALRDGAIAEAMAEMGVHYQCDLTGRGLSQLAPSVHMAIYRLTCEMLALLFKEHVHAQVLLSIRGGESRGRRWAVVRVEGRRTADQQGLTLRRDDWEHLVSRLGANGVEIETIRDRARIYGGQMRLRKLPMGLRASLLLHDIAVEERPAT